MTWKQGAGYVTSSAKLGEHYPDLKTTEEQERLAAGLERQEEEDTSHGEER